MTATGACGPLGLMTGDEEKKEGQGKQGVLWGQCPRAEGLSRLCFLRVHWSPKPPRVHTQSFHRFESAKGMT